MSTVINRTNTTLQQELARLAVARFTPQRALPYNPILDADSYKLSHFEMYPEDFTNMFSYGEARVKNDFTVFFGLQMWLLRYLSVPVTTDHIDEAEAFAKMHGEPFHRKAWELIRDKYFGYIPVIIKAVPEGMKVPSGNILYSIELTQQAEAEDGKLLAFLPSYIETKMQRAVWYPTTIATNSYKAREIIRQYLADTADNFDTLAFMLHDFGGRGVTCYEQSEIGGAAHLTSFLGSDTMAGVRAANFYYNNPMSAFSVWASEHSVMTLRGREGEDEMIGSIIRNFIKKTEGQPVRILSMVIDGYDTLAAVRLIGTKYKDLIVKSGIRLVFRPDSGDPNAVTLDVVRLADELFGHTVNSKGFKQLNNVGVLWGDGIDKEGVRGILMNLQFAGYSAANMVFGSGGGLLQKVNRDTYKFAQKASAAKIDGVWSDVYKDPITDPGKKSKRGRMTLLSKNGEFKTVRIEDEREAGWVEVLTPVWEHGALLRETTLDEVRARVNAS